MYGGVGRTPCGQEGRTQTAPKTVPRVTHFAVVFDVDVLLAIADQEHLSPLARHG